MESQCKVQRLENQKSLHAKMIMNDSKKGRISFSEWTEDRRSGGILGWERFGLSKALRCKNPRYELWPQGNKLWEWRKEGKRWEELGWGCLKTSGVEAKSVGQEDYLGPSSGSWFKLVYGNLFIFTQNKKNLWWMRIVKAFLPALELLSLMLHFLIPAIKGLHWSLFFHWLIHSLWQQKRIIILREHPWKGSGIGDTPRTHSSELAGLLSTQGAE